MVDILPGVRGMDFADAWNRRAYIVIDPESGLSVPVISRQDLIALKLAAGRPQDLADVAALRPTEEQEKKDSP